jgi:hypothetical protein
MKLNRISVAWGTNSPDIFTRSGILFFPMRSNT